MTPDAAFPVKLNLCHHIGGAFAAPSSKTFPVVNPATEEEIAQCAEGTVKDVDLAVAAAKKAYYEGLQGHKAWRHTSGTERRAFLDKFADLMERDKDSIAAIDTMNMGGPLFLTTMFVKSTIDMVRQVATRADQIVGETMEPVPSSNGPGRSLVMTYRQPFGVTAGICPWNAPTMMFAAKMSHALCTGNTIVIKDSEKTPLSGAHLMTLVTEAGIPPGVVNLVHGFGRPVGEALALHMDVRKISFTGSGLTGKTIMANAARSNLKNVSLELGGKSASIIFEDADLQKAVPASLFAGLVNSGQVCAAHTRLYVHESIVDGFVEGLKSAFASWVQGDPSKEGTMGGPLVDSIQYERVKSFLQKAKDEAEIVVGGDVVQGGGKGYYIQPTILKPKSDQVSVVRDEIFGPVLCVLPFKTEEEVIARANDSEYGLSGGIYTENLARGLRVAQELETGSLGVNCGIPLDTRAPFGGFKQSGIGREYGRAFIECWTEIKTVAIAI